MTNAPERGRWLREPLLQFLVIGAALFLLYRSLKGGNETAPREIVVSESRIEALAENFGTWMRPPTPQELGAWWTTTSRKKFTTARHRDGARPR